MRADDYPVHDWYRFVLSFPPHLVRDYLTRLNVVPGQVVLDPFCGTGTTLVECKKNGISSIGLERNPVAHLASSVKVAWSVDPNALGTYADKVRSVAETTLSNQGIHDWTDLPLLSQNGVAPTGLRTLDPTRHRLLLKNSISPLPLHKTLVLLDAIDQNDRDKAKYGRLALATALVRSIGNLKFGPEVGTGRIKGDAPVVDLWHTQMKTMVRDLHDVSSGAKVQSSVFQADARDAARILPESSVDAIITSPPYPNEKDYTRTTRLESVILGMVTTPKELRALKKQMIRSNTRGIYKIDDDDRAVVEHTRVTEIADEIERRRIALGKTSGFERMYGRVVKLYFGGMARHFASLRSVLRPGARLAYVVGDQASYLRVMIRTGQILAEIAASLGYDVVGIDLFRTRLATATRAQLREEVLLLRWPGSDGETKREVGS